MKSNLSFSMRLYLIDKMLQERKKVNFEDMMKELQCSAPTVKRDLQYMRDKLGAPIVYSRADNVYFYAHETKETTSKLEKLGPAEQQFWYSPEEVYVLMSVRQMLDQLEEQPGLLAGEMAPLKSRMLAMIEQAKIDPEEMTRRIKVVTPKLGLIKLPYFQLIGEALGKHKRVQITYFTQGRGEENSREISPLRLVNYHWRWYVEAWCHTTNALKTFSIENIRWAKIGTKNCKVVAMRDIQNAFDRTYGIFSSTDGERKTAVIEVDSVLTPYVKNEVWHDDQKITMHGDGSMTLEVPYAKEPELASRVIGLGSHARVAAPQSLKDYVKKELAAALELYAVDPVQ